MCVSPRCSLCTLLYPARGVSGAQAGDVGSRPTSMWETEAPGRQATAKAFPGRK